MNGCTWYEAIQLAPLYIPSYIHHRHAYLTHRNIYSLTNFAVVPQNHLAAHVGVHDLSTLASSPAVKNQWNGMVEWNTGMEYWNDI